MNNLQFIFIRHAESESNRGAFTNNPAEISLSTVGSEQAYTFAYSSLEKPDLIIVTPYIRTLQTAQPVATRNPNLPLETWPLHEFTYLSPSLCSNTTSIGRLPMVREYWEKCDPNFIHGEGAESFNQFSERIRACLDQLRKLEHNLVMIFTHGQVIRRILQFQEKDFSNPQEAMRYFRDIMMPRSIPNLYTLKLTFTDLQKIR